MILQVFSIYDSASGLYAQPSIMASKGVAIRSFTDQVNDPNSIISKHPDDYSLYYLADYDDETGTFNSTIVERLINGSDCVINNG